MRQISPITRKHSSGVYYTVLVVACVTLATCWLLPTGRTQESRTQEGRAQEGGGSRPRRASDQPTPQTLTAGEKISPLEKEELLCLARGGNNCSLSAPSAMAVAPSSQSNPKPTRKRLATKNKPAPGKGQRRNNHALTQSGGPRGVLNIEFHDTEARAAFRWPAGVTAFYCFQRFANTYIELNLQTTRPALEALAAAPGIVWMEVAGTPDNPLPPESQVSAIVGKGEPDKIARGGLRLTNGRLLTGAGVYLALLDNGIDYRNPDFVECQAGKPVSRIHLLVDATRPYSGVGKSLPFPSTDGESFTNQQLTNALQADTRANKACRNRSRVPNPGSNVSEAEAKTLRRQIGDTDVNGHGTAVAGIAAGNGNSDLGQTDVQGVAPHAKLIIVRLGRGENQKPELERAYLLNAVAGWLDDFARDTPLVISCSFGEHRGGHDGTRIAERQLNARFHPYRQGRALVAAAGNDGARNIHQTLNFTNFADTHWLTLGDAGKEPARIEIYNSAELSVPAHVKPRQWVHPLTGQTVMSLELRPGKSIPVTRNSGNKEPLRADAYLSNRAKQRFLKGGDAEKLVTAPATAGSVLAVGGYNWNDNFWLQGSAASGAITLCPEEPGGKPPEVTIGKLSYYSSLGFVNNSDVKPDLVAPGYLFRASAAVTLNEQRVLQWRKQVRKSGNACGTEGLDNTGQYVLFDGTSAATPYTAGIIALMFEKQPQLTLGEVHAWLLNKNYLVIGTPHVGAVPNIRWGHGKLQYKAIQRMLNELNQRQGK